MTVEKLEMRTAEQLETFLQKNENKEGLELVHRAENAKFTLVLIKQQHYSEIYNEHVYKQLEVARDKQKIEQLKKDYIVQLLSINKIQKQIYDFVLKETSSRDFLYVEGRPYPNQYRDIYIENYLLDTEKAVTKTLNFKGISSFTMPNPPFFAGASIKLQQERKLTVLGAENLSLLNLTLSLYENEKLPKNDLVKFLEECHEAREDQMLKNIAMIIEDIPYRMSSLRYLVCGSKHDFKNNILKWNEKNADKKFNLLVFTPKSLR